ncbi:hypothetical protein DPMN_160985 [Dreissena polymorpha]|uniref:Uncharacterized protein n=1 Tax=Dreissena polymorpha TaxID=45954 RepID=A0A9D4EML8_DREPO|nr:hypothetical protein DPMN_160985 [Dreissena polymorpha]
MPSAYESESDGNLGGSDENKFNTDKDGSECNSDDKNSFDVIENDERCTGNYGNDGESVDIQEYENGTGSNTNVEEEGTVTIEDMKWGSDTNMLYDEGSVLDTNKDYHEHCPYHESDEKTYDNGADSVQSS